MQLSDLDSEQFKIKVVRDGKFLSLGSFNLKNPYQLVFIDSEKFLPNLKKYPTYSCVITKEEFIPSIPKEMGISLSLNPMVSFYAIHNFWVKEGVYGGHFPSKISDKATVHRLAHVDPYNVIIGDGCIVYPHAVIHSGSVLKENVIIGSGAVIGNDGFRFIKDRDNIIKVLHAGGVVLHNDVEIQANACVCKAVYRNNTEIGEKTKIGVLVDISHNVQIGKRCLIVDHTMIAGGAEIGDDVWIGTGAVISDHVKIGDNAFVSIGAIVTKDVRSGQKVSGNFAIDHAKFLDFIRSIR
ncbi:MAG: UDP-3-O-(3-hydroxymyristoyl)glucosamine N-acyltransferase [Methanoregula sp.]|jgi:UDP-3-O-[3-hydroxymyristoyl] glucosamine N-acyltransferase|uniref:UDP-3-O-(3-hydroxymyristoyl)glucosamine N-acyltransferase n=1 Tax=Methanoregula sp. TaxID=2052170 RepID=UPI003C2A7F08